MQLIVVGVNHKTTPISLREKLAFSAEEIPTATKILTAIPGVREAIAVSTCNRVELYLAAERKHQPEDLICTYFAERAGVDVDDIRDHLYVHEDQDAIRHIFRVVSSLDSMVVGEPQIAGQVKKAFKNATDAETVGPYLDRCMRQAFSVSKRVRAETEIGQNAVSLAFLAVELSRQIFGRLKGKKGLLLGAGEMSSLAAKHLASQGATLTIANRSLERAQQLAEELGGVAAPFDTLPHLLTEADIVISSTSAQRWVITYDSMIGIVRARKNRPLFLIDLAVPRDIEPRVNTIDNVYLYDVDDMERVLEKNKIAREKEAQSASELVDAEVNSFMQRLKQRDVVPTVIALREHFHAQLESELEKFDKSNPDLSKAQMAAVTTMAKRLVNKLLHEPVINLKRATNRDDVGQIVDALHTIFELDKTAEALAAKAQATEPPPTVPTPASAESV
ncbi:MAG: glutamyl-tRNA reductase [Deltaproteobacteria bacterium CG17_big_fil_post_rev_8_21_14_2_50_63_7]|nr:MAG: glutamyl-tRNA reductase [Deltaproteobacteria bacterium CG17_big_fil_post_rev_8_21_14_2_50_63_7]